MVDKSKTIQESLAEVQRNAEQKRVERLMNEWENIDEAGWTSALKGGAKAATTLFSRPSTAAINQAGKVGTGPMGTAASVGPGRASGTGKFQKIQPQPAAGGAGGGSVPPVTPSAGATGAGSTGPSFKGAAQKVGAGVKEFGQATGQAFKSGAQKAGSAAATGAGAVGSAAKGPIGSAVVGGLVGSGVTYGLMKGASDEKAAAKTPSAPSNATALAKDAQSKGQKILPSTGYDSKGAGGEAAPMSNAPKPSAPRQSAPAKPELDISAQKDRPGYGAYWGKHDIQTEDGLKKSAKKKVSESTLINAFLELQNTKAGNVFDAAKKLSPKQKKIAKLAGDPNEIESEDLAALRAGKKPMEEDVSFSEAELQHIEAVLSETPVDQGKAKQTRMTSGNGRGDRLGPTVPDRDLTN